MTTDHPELERPTPAADPCRFCAGHLVAALDPEILADELATWARTAAVDHDTAAGARRNLYKLADELRARYNTAERIGYTDKDRGALTAGALELQELERTARRSSAYLLELEDEQTRRAELEERER